MKSQRHSNPGKDFKHALAEGSIRVLSVPSTGEPGVGQAADTALGFSCPLGWLGCQLLFPFKFLFPLLLPFQLFFLPLLLQLKCSLF